MKVLSLFDGMSCGMLAFQRADIQVDRYVAYEIDKYATKVASHNFPMIEQRGDVFQADFTEFEGFDAVVGGSPCTYWSIAQRQDRRETEAHGIGWELFQQYVRAIREAKPRFFIYENNKSMSDNIKIEISEAFGFEPIMINSALVSAQNRQRYYWVGIRNEDGTYRKADIDQPIDRGILLKDVIEKGWFTDKDKSHAVIGSMGRTTHREYFMKNQGQMVAGRMVGRRINEDGHHDDYNMSIELQQRFEVNENPQKTNCLTTVQKDNMIAEPIHVGALPRPNGELSKGQAMQIYSIEGKGKTQMANGGGMGGKTGLYAIPVNETKDGKSHTIKAQYANNTIANFVTNGGFDASGVAVKCDNLTESEKVIYEVKDGLITIKGKQYPIKLEDGFYIIRKLTVTECKRLQTVPEDYDMSVISNTQAYKCLGNGWTVEVIAHLIEGVMKELKE